MAGTRCVLRQKLRDALLYPALLACVAGAGVFVLLAFVVPPFLAGRSPDIAGIVPGPQPHPFLDEDEIAPEEEEG